MTTPNSMTLTIPSQPGKFCQITWRCEWPNDLFRLCEMMSARRRDQQCIAYNTKAALLEDSSRLRAETCRCGYQCRSRSARLAGKCRSYYVQRPGEMQDEASADWPLRRWQMPLTCCIFGSNPCIGLGIMDGGCSAQFNGGNVTHDPCSGSDANRARTR